MTAIAPEAPLGRTALRGGVFVGATQAVKIAVQFVALMILARLLTPVDFGIAAAAAPLFTLIALTQDFGFSEAIVQRPELTEDDLDRIFWALVGLGLLSAVAVAALTPAVAWWFADRRLIAFCIAAGAPACVASISALPLGLLNRHLQFAALSGIDIAASVCGLAVAVLAGWLGAGYWSLLLSSAAGTVITAAGAWGTAGFRPHRSPWRLPHRGFIAFGTHVTGFHILTFFSRNLDNVLIGQAWGLAQLGYYDRAYKLAIFPLQGVVWPLSRVTVPLLSRVQADAPRLREIYLCSVSVVVLGITPMLAGLAAAPDEVTAFLFGPGWGPVAPILFWLCLAGLQQPLNTSATWLFIAQGRTDALLRFGAFTSVTTTAAFVIGLHWGAVGVAVAYAVAEYTVRSPWLYWWVDRTSPVRVRDLIVVQAPVTAAMALTIPLTRFVLRERLGLHGILLIGASVALAYALALGLTLLSSANRTRLRAGVVLAMRHGHAVA